MMQLRRFKDYLLRRADGKTTASPATIKAQDLDDNFRMTTVIDALPTASGKAPAYTAEMTLLGTRMKFHVVTVHVCVEGVDKALDVLALGDPY